MKKTITERNISSAEFNCSIEELGFCIEAALRDQKPITKIVALSRGGLVPAVALAKRLNIRRIYNIGIEMYCDDTKSKKMPILYQTITETFSDDDVILLVDDIVDSGESMNIALSHLKEHNAQMIYTCALCWKPQSQRPSFYRHQIDNDTWVNFFWEQP